jgi:hypothetical protein
MLLTPQWAMARNCAIMSLITPKLSQLVRKPRTATMHHFVLGTGRKRAYNGARDPLKEAEIVPPITNKPRGTSACHSAAYSTILAFVAVTIWTASACAPVLTVRSDEGQAVDADSQDSFSRASGLTDERDGSHDLAETHNPIADSATPDASTQQPEIIALDANVPDLSSADFAGTADLAIAGDLTPDGTADADIVAFTDSLDALDQELTPGDLAESDKEDTCPYVSGVCLGLTYHWCDDDSGSAQSLACEEQLDGCHAAACIDEVGCQILPTFGNPCDDGDPCTVDDTCSGGECQPGWPMICDDGNPCTTNGVCTEGQCQPGPLVNCDDGNPCTDELCDSAGSGCVYSPNSSKCGLSEICVDSLCTAFPYPPPPFGPFQGDTMVNHNFLEPSDLSEHSMEEFHGDGKILLMTFNAGWCKVCKEDTALLNDWLAEHHDAGLRVLSILYETQNATPINQGYAQWWDEYYALTFPLWMDTPTADAEGEAVGGILETYRKPSGPVSQGYFPVTLIVCSATMEILYVDKGFYDEIIEEIVFHWLFLEVCG